MIFFTPSRNSSKDTLTSCIFKLFVFVFVFILLNKLPISPIILLNPNPLLNILNISCGFTPAPPPSSNACHPN